MIQYIFNMMLNIMLQIMFKMMLLKVMLKYDVIKNIMLLKSDVNQ